MIKHVYKGIILFFIFCGALFLFASNKAGNVFDESKQVEVGDETSPYLTIRSCGIEMNTLYGYRGPLDPAIVRESITPLDKDRKITLQLYDGSVHFQKLSYEILDKESGEVYEENTLNALKDSQRKIPIQFQFSFETSKEYILSLTATTDGGGKIHYYTRLKYYLDDSNLDEKMNFAMKFHEATFSKDEFTKMGPYLETNEGKPNNSLAKVDISSTQDMLTWGKLDPKVTSEIVPTIKEYNMETACIQLSYFVRATTGSGKESYLVKEFYRIRYSATRVFLLNFERTMEASFDEKLASTRKSQLKLGITKDTDFDMLTSNSGRELFFVRNGNLYYYDMNENEIHEIFRSFSRKASEGYRVGDQNGIRLNKLDSDGSLYFTVYGYFSRGQYEGKVAVVLYKYDKNKDQLDELVYLPMDTTYQILKEDFDPFSYVNSKGVYYFTVGSIVYSYNILGKKLDIIKENVKKDSFVALKNKACFAWSSSVKRGYGSNITIYNLENDEKKLLEAPSKREYIRLLGTIDSNIIYGYVKKKDIKTSKEGSRTVPCYKMKIVDTTGKVLKTYAPKRKYVSSISVEGNVLTINRVVKSGNGFKKISKDSILNQVSTEDQKVSLTSRVTTGSMLEWYINLPYGYVLTKVPKMIKSDGEINTSERAVHLDEPSITKYYVYALGEITGAYESPAKAISQADAQMGVVVSSRHQVVWERGGSYLMNSISGIENQRSGNDVSNIAACAYMVLKANHCEVTAKELSKTHESVYEMLSAHMDRPVNLSGNTLEQVLYFVSNGKPVIAMTSNAKAVVITGYNQTSVTVANPETGKEEKIGITDATKRFKAAGNRFISYMNDIN